MAAFELNADTGNSLDWTILRNGGVSLYRNIGYLDEDIATLEAEGYRSIRFNCFNWRTQAQMHDGLQEALRFPAYYGRNFNALWDCLQDVEIPDVGGLALILYGFTKFADGSMRDAARTLVDIFASASRYHSLIGRRLITLVQCDDPSLSLDSLASVSATWNRREWLNKSRGL
jgi:RNAse (barnase) inhibitor barstar